MVHLRPATLNDLPFVQQMAHLIWPATFFEILPNEQINYMLEMMYSIPSLSHQISIKKHRFILAQIGENYVGYASYENQYQDLPLTKIHKLYIMPLSQGLRIGTHLIEEIAQIAVRLNNKTLLLNVNKNNPAIIFYQKNGFMKISEEKIPIGGGFVMDDIVMEKVL